MLLAYYNLPMNDNNLKKHLQQTDLCSDHHHSIALTFDDLPGVVDDTAKKQMKINQRILNALSKFNVAAIGFVNEGKLYKKLDFKMNSTNFVDEGKPWSPKETEGKINILKLWVDKGYDLGNHTYSHLYLSDLTLSQFIAEVIKGSKVSEKLMQDAGRRYQYFRYPYFDAGDTPNIRHLFKSFLDQEGYHVAPVTINTEDWVFNQQLVNSSKNKDKIIQNYLEYTYAKISFYERASKQLFGRDIKQIWLLHVNLINSYVMESLLSLAKEFGYDFISLDEVFDDEVYQASNDYYVPSGVSWLYQWDVTHKNIVDWSKEPKPDNNLFSK